MARSVLVALLTVALCCITGVRARSMETVQGASGADQFWKNLQALCGGAFEGKVLAAPEGDTTFAGQRLVMHVRECRPAEVRIPFHVGEDRSRTWVFTRTHERLRLNHDHRRADGTPGERTNYGGEAVAGTGTPTKQDFPADYQTSLLLPVAKTNIWTIELDPGVRFVYSLRREGTDHRFRIEFDLSRRVAAPPPPWGAR